MLSTTDIKKKKVLDYYTCNNEVTDKDQGKDSIKKQQLRVYNTFWSTYSLLSIYTL